MKAAGMMQRAYGTPFWPSGRGIGDTVQLDPNVIFGGGDIVTNPGGVYPGASFPSSTPSWLPAVQVGVQDAFQFAKLLSPVPPGTVMQSGPGGTYIARAQSGQPTPGYFPAVGGAGFGWGTMLLIGGAILLVAAMGRER